MKGQRVKKQSSKTSVKREQPRKDSRSKRINDDNERVSKFERDIDREHGATNKCNDPRWYANSPELLRSAASIPFSPVPGLPLSQGVFTVPGVLEIDWCPAISQGADAPLNQAANSMYSFTVHANSRNQSYDAVDEMLLVLAGSQVFSALALGIRAYGIMRRYSQLDRYTPDALLRASGFNVDDLRLNYSKMWFDLNNLIARTQQIWIPNTMPVTERWFWLNSNIYMDGDSAKSQFYVFRPKHFLQYDETTNPNGGSLQTVQWNDKSHSWSEYITIMNNLINALISSQDRGIIFGDILKAYGADKLYAIKDLPVDYTVEPVYDKEVLTQIENLSTWYLTTGSDFGAIVQSDTVDYLQMIWGQTTTPVTITYPFGAPRTQVLNFHQKDTPTPEQVMVATRLKCMGNYCYGAAKKADGTTGVGVNVGPETCGTEVVVRLACWMYIKDTNTGLYNLTSNDVDPRINTTSTASGGPLPWGTVYRWSAFDWAPWLYAFSSANTPSSPTAGSTWDATVQGWLGDWDNYTFITLEELSKMHTTAIYSEFGVPVIM